MSQSEVNFNDTQSQRIAEQYRAGLIKGSDVRSYINRKIQAEGITKIDRLGAPPEGQYWESAREVSDYNRKVDAYNKELRNYRQDVFTAFRDYKTAPQAPSTPTPIEANYAQLSEGRQQVAEERRQEVQEISETGPPEPTEVERSRSEAGLPPKGIPGPGLIMPGSLRAKLIESTSEGLEQIEKPFLAITQPIRSVEVALGKLSIDALSTKQAYQPGVLLGGQTQPIYSFKDTFDVDVKPQPVLGMTAYLGGVAAAGLASGIDVGTFEIRPGLVKESASTLFGLVLDKDTQEAAVKLVADDPFKFVASIIGGAVVGQSIKVSGGKIESGLRQRYAKYQFDKVVGAEELFTQFERDLNLDFPEETVEASTKQTLFKRGELKILDDRGLPIKKLPYYLETDPEIEKLFKLTQSDPETWTPAKIGQELEAYYALPFDDEGGSILVKGKAGMKPFKPPAPMLPPRNEQVLMYDSKVKASMRLKPMADFFKTTMTTEQVWHFPAVDLISTLAKAAKATIPSLTPPGLTIASLVSLKNIQNQDQRLENDVSEMLKLQGGTKQIVVQTTPIIPKLKDFTETITDQKPFQFQELELGLVQIPELKQIQIEEPMPMLDLILEPPTKPFVIPPPPKIEFKFPPPPPPPLIRVKKKKKKKKKKGKRKIKGAYELRVDTIVNKIMKGFKL